MKKIWILLFVMSNFIGFSQSITLMSYNMRLDVASDGENSWPNRKEYFIGQIRFYEPAIFGVQEALPHQVLALKTGLDAYQCVGKSRDGENEGESSNIFFKKDRFKLLETQTFWLSETPEKISMGWDAACRRVCTYVILEDKQTKSQICVMNTHFDHIGKKARMESAKLVMEVMEKLEKKSRNIFLMGDFNATPDDEIIVFLKSKIADSKEISEQKAFGPDGTFNAFRHQEAVNTRIDYIFVNFKNQFRVKKYGVLSDSKDLKYPSDHLPVWAEMVFGKQKVK